MFYTLSNKFGWTPNEIRQMSVDDIKLYIELITIENKISK